MEGQGWWVLMLGFSMDEFMVMFNLDILEPLEQKNEAKTGL